MTTIAAELPAKATAELIERKRVARLIVLASGSFTVLIAIVASILAIAA
jgi:hypothetical protein